MFVGPLDILKIGSVIGPVDTPCCATVCGVTLSCGSSRTQHSSRRLIYGPLSEAKTHPRGNHVLRPTTDLVPTRYLTPRNAYSEYGVHATPN